MSGLDTAPVQLQRVHRLDERLHAVISLTSSGTSGGDARSLHCFCGLPVTSQKSADFKGIYALQQVSNCYMMGIDAQPPNCVSSHGEELALQALQYLALV